MLQHTICGAAFTEFASETDLQKRLREKQAGLLKALLDADDFRTRAGSLVMGSIYDSFTEGGVAPAVPPRED